MIKLIKHRSQVTRPATRCVKGGIPNGLLTSCRDRLFNGNITSGAVEAGIVNIRNHSFTVGGCSASSGFKIEITIGGRNLYALCDSRSRNRDIRRIGNRQIKNNQHTSGSTRRGTPWEWRRGRMHNTSDEPRRSRFAASRSVGLSGLPPIHVKPIVTI